MGPKTSKPLVSVVTSVYGDDLEGLKKTIVSITSQTFTDFEFILVDDGVSKRIKKYLGQLKDRRIKIITNKKNKGLTRSLNIAIAHSLGKYIARIDAGDYCDKTRIDRQVAFFENNSKIGLLGTACHIVNTNGKLLKKTTPPSDDKNIRNLLPRQNVFTHSSIMFKKNVAAKVAFYDEQFTYAQDYDLYLRLLPHTKFANLSEPLTSYVLDLHSISYGKNRTKQEWCVLKARNRYFKKKPSIGYTIVLLKSILPVLLPTALKRKISIWRLQHAKK